MEGKNIDAEKGGNRPAALKPGYLAALVGMLTLVLVIFAVYEIDASRQIIRRAMENGALSLAEAVARAGENALRADAEIEAMAAEHLLDNARLIRELESKGGLSDTLLMRIGEENGLFRIHIFDSTGVRLVSNLRGMGWNRPKQPLGAVEELAPILNGWEEEQIIGFKQAKYRSGNRFAAAVRRYGGGAVLVNIDAAQMLAFRRAAGVGRLIQEIEANPGVIYIAVQDTVGIFLASQKVVGLTRIVEDRFLEDAWSQGNSQSRITEFEGQEVFETVMPFTVDEEGDGLLRIGLGMEGLQAEEARVMKHLGLLTVLLIVLGTTGVGWVAVRQNFRLLDEAHAHMQTYSGRILESMADAVVATDADGTVQVFNRAAERLFGISAGEVQNQPCSAIMREGASPLERTLQSGEELREEECTFRNRRGREIILSVSTSLVRNRQGQVETAVAVIQDLTEKRELEADLRRRDRLVAMGELASGMAHEVRNPLNAISIIVQRLGREFEPITDQQQYRDFIKTVRDEVRRVDRIVQQFLTFARPPVLAPQSVDLDELLEESVRVIEPKAQERNIGVQRSFAGIGTVRVDPEQMKQVVLNLLSNAVEATAEGAIRIATRTLEDERVEIEVEDTGTGISPEDLERIFDLYYTTKAEGMGLGLGMVQRIVSEHGGRVTVKSEMGAGTKFILNLPRGKDDGERDDSGH